MTLDIGKDLAAHAESHQAGYQAGLADGRREQAVAIASLRTLFIVATGYTVDEYQEMRRQVKADYDDPPRDIGQEPPIRVTNHDISPEDRLNDPQHGQASELNRR